MKNTLIGIVVGIVIGIVLFLGVQDYLVMKARVKAIESFLIQAQNQAQQRPAAQPPAK
jgi:uncharacterized membrane protein